MKNSTAMKAAFRRPGEGILSQRERIPSLSMGMKSAGMRRLSSIGMKNARPIWTIKVITLKVLYGFHQLSGSYLVTDNTAHHDSNRTAYIS